ncbi:hypothetical protein ACOSQ3_015125 [Xanthoceras sorbifolium]
MDRKSLEGRLILPESSPNINGKPDDDDEDDVDSSVTAAFVFSSSLPCAATLFLDVVSVVNAGYSSLAESGIMKDLGLSLAAYSVFGSAMTIGGLMGSLVSGKVADLIGRKARPGRWILEESPMELESDLLVMRCILDTSQAPIYVSEIAPKNIRGALTSANVTQLFCRVLQLMFSFVVPCLVQVCGTFFIPESPRWLAKIGRGNEIDAILRFFRGKNANISLESANIKDCTEAFQKLSEDRILNLFQRRYDYSLMVSLRRKVGKINVFVGLDFRRYTTALCYYASSIFEKANISCKVGTISVAIIQVHDLYKLQMKVNFWLVQFTSFILSVMLVDKSGRKPLLLVSAIGTCLCCFLVGLSFCLQNFHNWKEIVTILGFIGILGFILTYAIDLAGIPPIIMSEVFPINIKGSAGILVTFLGNSCSWIVSYFFNRYLNRIHRFVVNFIFSQSLHVIISFLFVAKLVPEIKGRTLEETQASMNQLLPKQQDQI